MKKAGIIVVVVLALFFMVRFIFGTIKSAPDDSYLTKGKAPLIIAHGGTKQLAPENTMLAFDEADKYRPDVMEMDVVMTKDSVLITCHDPKIDRITDGKGLVAEYTFEELKQFNFAYRFKDAQGNYPYRDTLIQPTRLENVLAQYGRRYDFCIELKDYPPSIGECAARQLYSLLCKYDMKEKTLVASFEDHIVKYFRQLSHGEIKTSSGKEETKTFVILSKTLMSPFFTSPSYAIQIPVKRDGFTLDEQSLRNAAHRKNMAVHYWTINDKEQMRDLIQKGADGIITDRPDIANELLKEMKLR